MKHKLVPNLRLTVQLVVSLSLIVLGTLLAMWRRGVGFNSLSDIQAHFDGLAIYALAKGFFESPWSLWNYNLGYPNGFSVVGQPGLNWVHIATLWVLVWIIGQPIVAVNFLFFLGFGLAVAAAFWVLRFYKVRIPLALVLAFSFAFIPEHWNRQSHLYLSLYWTVPLSCFYLVQINNGGFGKFFTIQGSRKKSIFRAAIFGLFLVFLVQQGVYYAVFTFILTAGTFLIRLLVHRKLDRDLKVSLAILVSHAFLMLGSLAIDTRLARWAGTNLEAFARSQFESLLYGGLMPQLIYPWPGSGLYLASNAAQQFPNALSRLSMSHNENQIWQGLIPGLCIAIAIVFIVFSLVKSSREKSSENSTENPQIISMAFLIGILFYIAGGLGFLLAMINPQIRAWNRLSFHISFLAILLVGIVVSRLIDKVSERLHWQRQLITTFATSILSIVLALDSFPKVLTSDVTKFRNETNELKLWVASVETQTGGNCAILQLPFVSYPEMPPAERMDIYQEFLPYLVSKNLKFTFGSMKNSDLSNWQRNLPDKVDAYLMQLAAGNGFCAISWDSWGLSPEELSDLKDTAMRLNLDIVQSDSGRWGSINLVPLAEKMNQEEKFAYRNLLLDALQVSVVKGLSGVEQDSVGLFSWATSSSVEISVYNPSQTSTKYTVDFSISTSPSGMKREFQIDWQDQSKTVILQGAEAQTIRLEINLEGDEKDKIKINASGSPDSVPGDPRLFYFKLRNGSTDANYLKILKGENN
jgi:phosphoglycerol transferase